jgi:hypothetical protein
VKPRTDGPVSNVKTGAGSGTGNRVAAPDPATGPNLRPNVRPDTAARVGSAGPAAREDDRSKHRYGTLPPRRSRVWLSSGDRPRRWHHRANHSARPWWADGSHGRCGDRRSDPSVSR